MKQIIFTVLFLSLIVTECSAQWQNEYFPNPVVFGGSVTCFFASEQGEGLFRYDPSHPTKWASADSGMYPGYMVPALGSIGAYIMAGGYRSSDDGSHWLVTRLPEPSNCFLTVGNYIFSAGTDVWHSTDSGMNWTASQSGIKNYHISSLANIGDTLFAGTTGGVFVSTDSGQHWQPTGFKAGVNALAVLDTTLFAAIYGGVYHSKDLGVSWIIDTTGLFSNSDNSIVTDGKNLFVGTGWIGGSPVTSLGGSGVFLSTDSGQHWDTINYGLPQGTSTDPTNFLSVNALGIFDTLLFVGVWDGGGTVNRTYVRSIPEILRQKGDTTASVVSQPTLAGDSIMVYPNPTTASVSIFAGGTSILGVRVLNLLGTEVLNLQSERASIMSIDLSKLPSGTYFLEIETPNGIILRKVIRE